MSLVSSVSSAQRVNLQGRRLDHSTVLKEFVSNVWKVFHVRLEVDLQALLPKKISSILRHFDNADELPIFVSEKIQKLKNITKLEKRGTITPEDRAEAFVLANHLLQWMMIEGSFLTQEAIGRQTGLPTPLWKSFRSMGEAIEEESLIKVWLNTHQKALAEVFTLFVENCRLAILPDWIVCLGSLRVLKLSRNHLYFLPDSIGGLAALEKLIVHANRLICLPETLGNLRSLKVLAVSENRLSDVPESIHQLHSLTELNLCTNLIKVFPRKIVKLASLERLLLKENQLTELPQKIGNMTALKELDVDGNNLVAVPATIGSLTSLQMLSLKGNYFNTLPRALARLSSSCAVVVSNQNFSFEGVEVFRDELERVKAENPLLGPQLSVKLKAGKHAQALEKILAFWIKQFETFFPEEQIENWNEDEFTRPLFSCDFNEGLREEDHLDRLTTFLHGLKYTKDYQKNKKSFIGIVGRMIGQACNGSSKELFDALQHSKFDSDDQVAAALNLIEIKMHYRSLKFRFSGEVNLAQLLIRLYRLKVLNTVLEKQIETAHPIETLLFFHLSLKNILKLPLSIEEMVNPGLVGISEELVRSVGQLVLSQTSSREQIKKILLASNSWERAVQLIESEKLAAIIESTKMEDGLILKLTESWLEDHFAEL